MWHFLKKCLLCLNSLSNLIPVAELPDGAGVCVAQERVDGPFGGRALRRFPVKFVMADDLAAFVTPAARFRTLQHYGNIYLAQSIN